MCWYLIGMESFVLLSVDVEQVGMTVREMIGSDTVLVPV